MDERIREGDEIGEVECREVWTTQKERLQSLEGEVDTAREVESVETRGERERVIRGIQKCLRERGEGRVSEEIAALEDQRLQVATSLLK